MSQLVYLGGRILRLVELELLDDVSTFVTVGALDSEFSPCNHILIFSKYHSQTNFDSISTEVFKGHPGEF